MSLNYLAAILEDKNARTATTQNNCAAMEERRINYFKELDKEHAKGYLQKYLLFKILTQIVWRG